MEAYDIIFTGIVQGVGFRPFIKRVALASNVYGYVRNMGGGEVVVHIEGYREAVKEFFRIFWKGLPPPAEIYSVSVSKSIVNGFKTFEILKSGSNLVTRSIIPPDIGICRSCIEEIDDPTSRWYNYPFNSCAWCGPRFSMMYRTPYDRENTSMSKFPLCSLCRSEYMDVSNIRRFHAQGISCGKCGPRIWLTDNKGVKIDVKEPIKEAAKLIEEGYIVGIKGIGGFHIACRADDDEVVNKLRIRKRRPYKPFALMALDIETVSQLAYLNNEAIKLLTSPQKPIVLLKIKEGAAVSKYVAPGLDTIGVMLPYSGIHYILLRDGMLKYMIMTSGNYYEKPMEKSNESAIKRIGDIVDYFLLHNREIVNRVDDSVIRFTVGKPTFLRRSRGYAPKWILLSRKLPNDVIAFGAELQNTGGIGFHDKAILTQYIGDTDEYENLRDLDYYLKWFTSIYGIDPRKSIYVIDMHPLYNSGLLGKRWAEEYGGELIRLQHHAAHAYSILAEYNVSSGIVIAIDGVGYGLDGNIWGGEVIEIEEGVFKRVKHIKYVKMLGGDQATIYPARILYSIIATRLGPDEAYEFFLRYKYVDYLRSMEELEVIRHRYVREKLYTSSLGRHLDAYSTLLHICGYRSYEGEPAMKLEAYGRGGKLISELIDEEVYDGDSIDLTEIFIDSIDYIESGKASLRDLAYTFQYLSGYYLGLASAEYASENGYRYIYLTGGAAVNDFIAKGISDAVKKIDSRLVLRLHKLVPPGDGGISLGQIYYIVFRS